MTAKEPPRSVHAFGDDALGNHDATGLAELLRKGALSIREVTDAAIARAEKVESQLHGIVTPDFDQARSRRELSGNGLFDGVPTLIKDNTDVRGLPTRFGSRAITEARPAADHSPFTHQYLAQGFVCLGKSSLPEFGFNATTEPAHSEATRNPWNLDYSCGASSGGSAALVAAGVVPIAHANDGGGSIRIPAACCGLVGLKPSRGRLVDNEAAKSLPVKIISEGVVTRSVRDTANFFAEAERFYCNRKLPEIGRVTHPPQRPMKIGLVLDSINSNPTDSDTRETVEATAHLLQDMGHQVTPVPVPVADSFPEDFALLWGMLAFAVKNTGKATIARDFDRRRLDALTDGLSRMFARRFHHLPGAILRLRRSYHDYALAMAGYDAVLTPVTGHTTPEIGYLSPDLDFDTLFGRLLQFANFTALANATGAPAIALPMGATRTNLPIAVQLMACHGRERVLLELAFALEAAAPWRRIEG